MPVYRQRAEWWDMREAQIYQSIEQGQTDLIVQQFDGVEGVKEMTSVKITGSTVVPQNITVLNQFVLIQM